MPNDAATHGFYYSLNAGPLHLVNPRHASIGPALAGDVGEAYVDVAGADAAVFGQR